MSHGVPPHGRFALAAAALVAAVFALGVGCAEILSETPVNGCGPDKVPPGGWLLSTGSGPRYDVPANTDNIWTNDFKYLSHVAIDVHHVRLTACPGAASLMLLTTDADLEDSLVVGLSEPDWTAWRPLLAGGSDGVDWTLPDSVALRVLHHAQLETRAHYLNLPGAPVSGDRAGVVTMFEPLATGDPKYLLSSLVIEDTAFALAPHAIQTVTKTATVPHEVTLLALAAEYHKYGTGLTVETASMGGGPWTTVCVWTAAVPQFVRLDAPVTVPAGGQIRVTATYDNTSDQTVLPGPRWDGDETLRLFAFHIAAPLPAPAEALLFQ